MGMSRKEAGKLGAIKTKLLFEKINLEKKQEYYKNPLICKHCGNPHDYGRRKNKFCSISCATTFNNLKKEKKQYKCLNCNTILIGKAKKYCNTSCQMNYNMNQSIQNNSASSKTIKRFLTKTYINDIEDYNFLPSQIEYIHFTERQLKNYEIQTNLPVCLKKIKFSLDTFSVDGCVVKKNPENFIKQIIENSKMPFDCKVEYDFYC